MLHVKVHPKVPLEHPRYQVPGRQHFQTRLRGDLHWAVVHQPNGRCLLITQAPVPLWNHFPHTTSRWLNLQSTTSAAKNPTRRNFRGGGSAATTSPSPPWLLPMSHSQGQQKERQPRSQSSTAGYLYAPPRAQGFKRHVVLCRGTKRAVPVLSRDIETAELIGTHSTNPQQ